MVRQSPERLRLLAKRLRERGIASGAPAGIPRRPAGSDAPLSFDQRRLWFLDQLDPGNFEYNDGIVQRIRGIELEPETLRLALKELVARHEVLRTRFVADGGVPVQRVLDALEVPLRFVDLTGRSTDEVEREARRLRCEDVRGPFRLDAPPLFRVTLARRGTTDHELTITMHHIVSDGVSFGVLCDELSELLTALRAGRDPALPRQPIQFGDFAKWETESADEARIREKLGFWTGALADAPAPPALGDGGESGVEGPAGAFHRFTLDGPALSGLRDLCRRDEATSNQVLLAAYFAFLAATGRGEDLVVGIPSSSRNSVELERLIGFFVHTVPLRLDLSGNPTFHEILARTRAAILRASQNEDVPYDRIVQALRASRGTSEPLVRIWFAHMKGAVRPLSIEGARVDYEIVEAGQTRFDVSLILDEHPERIDAYFEYDRRIFSPARIAELGRRYAEAVRACVEQPETRLLALGQRLDRIGSAASEPAPPRRGARLPGPRRARMRSGPSPETTT